MQVLIVAAALLGAGPPGSDELLARQLSDTAGVWYHLHVLCADGVFCEYADRPDVPFEAQPPPTDSNVADLVGRVRARVHRYFQRLGLHAADPGQALLRRCADATAARVRTGTPAAPKARRSHLCAERDGFGLHAAVSVAPDRPAELERICRYLSRPRSPTPAFAASRTGGASCR